MKPTSTDRAQNVSQSKFEAMWHHRPQTVIEVSPFFSWPPKPMKMVRWITERWLSLAENVILLGLAFVCWFWFQPSLEEAKVLHISWIAEIYIRNFVLITCVAGGLHLYFYAFKKQGDTLKFDARPLREKARGFTFGSQVRDNIFWTLASGVTIWTAYEVLIFWGMANGFVPVLTWQENPVWFVALFALTPLWISIHFYAVHRWMHWPPLYKIAHALHHRNTNVGPWSGISMHPIEHILFFSSILLHWLLAAHPVHILFHMQHQALTGSSSHTGFEALTIAGKKRLALGTFHHQMHHRYLDCNYGNLEVPLDKWFGSFHNGTLEAHNAMLQRRGSADN